MSLEAYRDRFLCRVDQRGPDDCWPWKAWRTKAGHGRFCVWDSKRRRVIGVMAHRAIWELEHGPIPNGLQVLHNCDNPPCCNPDHLKLGTVADNMRDRKNRGRYNTQPRGEKHWRARLTEAAIREMMRRRAKGETLKALSEAFGVDCSTVHLIAKGRNWQHLKLGVTEAASNIHPQSAKTHCPSGHPYDEVNTWRSKDGERVCKECKRAHYKDWYDRTRRARRTTSR